MRLKNLQDVHSTNKNLVGGSLLSHNRFKLVFDSNKVVVSKFGLFIGKEYKYGGLFHHFLSDFCKKFMNHVYDTIGGEANVWHSRLYHINFGCMSWLSSLNLIPKFFIVKGSKCQTCVQAKQTR